MTARRPRLALAAFCLSLVAADAPPVVVRVKVPASRVGLWFPKGTELISVPLEELDALVRRVEQTSRPSPKVDPAILRVDHRARWEAGRLIGASTFTVRRDPAVPASISLSPWNLAIEAPTGGGREVRSDDRGATSLWLSPGGGDELSIGWRHSARPSSLGRTFRLELPRQSPAVFTLDLPSDLIPERFSPVVDESRPPAAGRRHWRLDGASGPLEIRLRPAGERGETPRSRPWINGPSTIEVGPGGATWRADWTVDLDGQTGPLRVEYSPDLQPIDVSGPGVESFQPSLREGRNTVVIHFRPEVVGSTSLSLRGSAAVPLSGTWTVPTAWPMDGVWTGGRVAVRLGPSRTIRECRVLQGSRLAPRSDGPADKSALLFEPVRAGPVAELVFDGRPPLDTASVRGRVRATGATTTLTAVLTWTFPTGQAPDLAFDLPEGWSIERIGPDGDAPLAWHQEPLSEGLTRVRVAPAPFEEQNTSIELNLRATRMAQTGPEPIELPRIRPLGIDLIDELWIASADGDRVPIPKDPVGLAWITPAEALARTDPAPLDPGELARAIAWRWTAPEGRLSVSLAPGPREVTARIVGTASVAEGRHRLDWRVSIPSGSRLGGLLPVFLSVPPLGEISWLRRGAAGSSPVLARPLTPEERALAGFPIAGGFAFGLTLPDDSPAPIDLQGSLDEPHPPGRVAIPLLFLPESVHSRATLALRVERDRIAKVESGGLTGVEFDDETPRDLPVVARRWFDGFRLARHLDYQDFKAFLHVQTERPVAAADRAFIASARLFTACDPSLGRSDRLILDVRPGPSRQLRFKTSAVVRLDRSQVNGRVVAPVADGGDLILPLGDDPGREAARVVLEWHSVDGSPGVNLAPDLPRFDAACDRFTWDVGLPERWSVARSSGGLVATEPESRRTAYDILTRGSPLLVRSESFSAHQSAAIETIVELRSRSQALFAGRDLDLAQWLGGLDRAIWPVIVDRLAMEAANLTPASTLSGLPAVAAWSVAERPARLEVGGLRLIPWDGAVVVTTETGGRPGSPIRRSQSRIWSEAIHASLLAGSDPSGRFESATRWRGDTASIGSFQDDGPGLAARGMVVRGFQRNGWPTPEDHIRPTRSTDSWIAAMGLAVGLLAAGLATLRLGDRSRGRLLGLLLGLSVALCGFADSSRGWVVAGVVIATAATFAAQLARPRVAPAAAPPSADGSRGPRSRLSGTTTVGLVTILIIVLVLAVTRSPAGPAVKDDAILVLLPYEGEPDPGRDPHHAVLRLADFERLKSQAEPPRRAVAGGTFATEAAHHLDWIPDGGSPFSSEFALVTEGPGPFTWSLPARGASDITATLDGRPHPVRIVDEGRLAVVEFSAEGRHRLRFDRVLRFDTRIPSTHALMAINAVAATRLVIETSSKSWSLDVEGEIVRDVTSSGKVEGKIGPTPVIDARLRDLNSGRSRGGFTALALWDARPAGDLLRLRLTPTGSEPVADVRLSLDSGVQVRVPDVRRLVDSRWEGDETQPVWVGSFDPPLQRDQSVAIEVWQPSPRLNPAGATGQKRASPRVRLADRGDFSGMIAFRRPGDWSGRLRPVTGFVATEEESFVRSWGTLPDEPYTLAGARGFQSIAEAEVTTVPRPTRRTIRPNVRLELGEGRIDFQVEAELRDLEGHSVGLDLRTPPSLRLDHLSADGLVSVSRAGEGRFHLEFRPIDHAPRKIVIGGHQDVPSEGLLSDPRKYQARTPWLTWDDAIEEPGVLSIGSLGKPRLESGPGVVPLPVAEPFAGGSALAAFRKVYQVNHAGDLGASQWQSAPPRVAVALHSRLAVAGRSAELNTIIRYDVSGGPLELLYVKLPTAWAAEARVELVGESFQRTVETKGEWTNWTLRPQRPIWGHARLILRAVREGLTGQSILFPDVSPRGQGTVEKTLSVERRTSLPIELEGSPGLQSIDAARLADLSLTPSTGPISATYRVPGDQWSLRIKVGSSDPKNEVAEGGLTVKGAELTCALDREQTGGLLRGVARYFVETSRGAVLRVRLPASARVEWATIDGARALALAGSPGDWILPFDSTGSAVVDLAWNTPAATLSEQRGRLALPWIDSPDVPTLVSIYADSSVGIVPATTRVETLSDAAWQLERVERLARRIVARIAELDRSSPAHELELVQLLAAFEANRRDAARSIDAGLDSSIETSRAHREQFRARLDRTRAAVAESLELNGLDELQPAALPRSPLSLARLGVVHHFRWLGGGSEGDADLLWERLDSSAWTSPFRWLGLLLAGSCVLLGPLLARVRRAGPAYVSWLVLLGLTLLAPAPGLIVGLAIVIGRSRQ